MGNTEPKQNESVRDRMDADEATRHAMTPISLLAECMEDTPGLEKGKKYHVDAEDSFRYRLSYSRGVYPKSWFWVMNEDKDDDRIKNALREDAERYKASDVQDEIPKTIVSSEEFDVLVKSLSASDVEFEDMVEALTADAAKLESMGQDSGRRALKFDDDKTPLHLVDPMFIRHIAIVLGYGAQKYEPWNWSKGTFEWHRLYRAAIGHLMDWYEGEDLDPESGLSHLAHASCCLMFLIRYAEMGWGTDDRPRMLNHRRQPPACEDRS